MEVNNKGRFSVLIAEDEEPAMDYLVELASKRTEFKSCRCSMDGKDTLEKLLNENYDILFLDINLTVISGIEILKKIKNPPYVIITTAYPYPALHDLNIAEMDYLFKPFSEDMFNNVVEKAINNLNKQDHC